MTGEWVEKAIGDIADVIGGSTPSTRDPANFDGDVPWLTPKDLAGPHPRYVSRGERNLSRKGLERCSAQLLPPNSVLLSSRAPIGYVAIAANPIATNQGFRSLVVKPDYDHEFVYYWLLANVEELERHATGSTFKEIPGSALKQIRIRLPRDRAEQRAIAHILGTLDDKIELNRRMSETLEQMARALFKSWLVDFDPVRAKMEGRWRRGQSLPGLPARLYDLFPDRLATSELGEIPEGWEVGNLSDLCSTQYGYTASAVAEHVGPKFLRVTDINKQNWINWADVPHCHIDPDAKQAYALKVGDIVVARMADPGKSAIIEEEVDAVFASYLVRLKTRSLAHSYYVYGFLKSDLYAEYAEGAKSGSVQANMNAKVIVAASLVVPPTTVMDQFLRAILPLRQRLVSNVRESRTLAALRDALLPRLISGELRVKDAERFLERMRV
ncbi:MAG: type I restriction system specificity protein [Candidatus Binatia bacterium]|nr:MAG: type I restriction system specificity protein [Candidatus Binatia bacterium]